MRQRKRVLELENTSHVPPNRADLVRLLTEFEQKTRRYFKQRAIPFVLRSELEGKKLRAKIDETLDAFEAQLRVASRQVPSKSAVAFQKRLVDLVASGKSATKVTLPALQSELAKTVAEFLEALEKPESDLFSVQNAASRPPIPDTPTPQPAQPTQ